jgi:hypothetical protein
MLLSLAAEHMIIIERVLNSNESEWWGGEPSWVTAEKWGHIAAVVFWPGSEAMIKGRRPTHYLAFNDSLPNTR